MIPEADLEVRLSGSGSRGGEVRQGGQGVFVSRLLLGAARVPAVLQGDPGNGGAQAD